MTSTTSDDEAVAVIVGSTRPTRIGPGIAEWSRRTLDEHSSLTYRTIDLALVDLPLLDEPLKAALHDYRHEHTKAWSALISSFAGFVFVSPQYNWGYPAALKNALDYLYDEWHHKPVTTVTYGYHGGGAAADQLRQVCTGLHMTPLDHRVEITITDDQVDEHWQLKDLDTTMRPYRDDLRRLDAALIDAVAMADHGSVAGPDHGGAP